MVAIEKESVEAELEDLTTRADTLITQLIALEDKITLITERQAAAASAYSALEEPDKEIRALIQQRNELKAEYQALSEKLRHLKKMILGF
jgi:predicted  nucleic acid-binding Zn-ribbon protein